MPAKGWCLGWASAWFRPLACLYHSIFLPSFGPKNLAETRHTAFARLKMKENIPLVRSEWLLNVEMVVFRLNLRMQPLIVYGLIHITPCSMLVKLRWSLKLRNYFRSSIRRCSKLFCLHDATQWPFFHCFQIESHYTLFRTNNDFPSPTPRYEPKQAQNFVPGSFMCPQAGAKPFGSLLSTCTEP